MKPRIFDRTAIGANPVADQARPLLYTRRQAAELLGVSPAYVYAMATRSEIEFVELPSRGGRRRGRMMFKPADLEDFINRNRKKRTS